MYYKLSTQKIFFFFGFKSKQTFQTTFQRNTAPTMSSLAWMLNLIIGASSLYSIFSHQRYTSLVNVLHVHLKVYL